jgi:hypothetical protein
VGELSERPELRTAFELLKGMARNSWKEAFGADAPELNLSAVEYVAGFPQLSIDGAKTPGHPESNGRMMIGCGGVEVRFKQEVDWRAWVKKYVPAAQERTDDGLVYFEQQLPAFGPAPLTLAARDNRTIMISGGVDYLHKLMAATTGEAPNGVLGGWSDLQGGLVAAVFGDARVDRSAKTPDMPQAEVVLQNTKTFGVALDLSPTSNQMEIRADLTCSDANRAKTVRQAIEELLPLATRIVEAELKNPPPLQLEDAERKKWKQTAGDETTDRQVAEFWLGVIKSCAVRVESHDDGAARVRLSATAAFPRNFVTAYEVAEKTDATKAKTK